MWLVQVYWGEPVASTTWIGKEKEVSSIVFRWSDLTKHVSMVTENWKCLIIKTPPE